jgi:hypothetical protein
VLRSAARVLGIDARVRFDAVVRIGPGVVAGAVANVDPLTTRVGSEMGELFLSKNLTRKLPSTCGCTRKRVLARIRSSEAIPDTGESSGWKSTHASTTTIASGNNTDNEIQHSFFPADRVPKTNDLNCGLV